MIKTLLDVVCQFPRFMICIESNEGVSKMSLPQENCLLFSVSYICGDQLTITNTMLITIIIVINIHK